MCIEIRGLNIFSCLGMGSAVAQRNEVAEDCKESTATQLQLSLTTLTMCLHAYYRYPFLAAVHALLVSYVHFCSLLDSH